MAGEGGSGENSELGKQEEGVTVGLQRSGGKGNRRDDMVLISEACGLVVIQFPVPQ